MKKLISLGVLVIAVTVSVVIGSSYAQAEEIRPTQAQCTTAQERLTARITRVEAAKTAQTKVYTGLQTKLETLVSSATQNEYDTTALVAAQEAFTAKIAVYTEKTAAYSSALLAVKNAACSTTNTEFVKAVTDARTALAAARTATNDVRAAFRGAVITELKNYATWLKEQTGKEGEK